MPGSAAGPWPGPTPRFGPGRADQRYIGKSETLAEALWHYAQAYATQNERDFERFQQACRKGRLQARSEADFAADHLP